MHAWVMWKMFSKLLWRAKCSIRPTMRLKKIPTSLLKHRDLMCIRIQLLNVCGKHGCLKCTVVGYHHPTSRTTCFPGTNAPLRT
uniref:Uncharacterized protein n=1 Tax=Anopheles quadriannulatus TaxID=34691 RepID=A0A182XQ27_ANOQN